MDLNTILGWSVTLLVIVGLVIFFRIRKKNRDVKTLAPLKSFARENNSEISDSDAWSKNLIGIDKNDTGSLFFIRSLPAREIREKINLSEVLGCKVNRTVRKVDSQKDSVSVIDRIELIISFHQHKPDVSLEFYNTDYDQLTLIHELQLSQKWGDMIQGIVKVNRKSREMKQKNETPKNMKKNPESAMTASA